MIGLAAPPPSPAILLGGHDPRRNLTSSYALVYDRVRQPPSCRRRFSGGDCSSVRASRREFGGGPPSLRFRCVRKRSRRLRPRRPIEREVFLHVRATLSRAPHLRARLAGCRRIFGVFQAGGSPAVPTPIRRFSGRRVPRCANAYSAFLGWRFPRRANAK